ncbi:MAG: carboxyl transferase [Clostridium sp.]|nr:carboxyl transferase [Clostridium sp.]MCM1400158.1 carboxyl transferase [Clostridium sp.]MCM1460890.1 methylmalonyl-CoA carboxyltransferase [Bacteroides sp.]
MSNKLSLSASDRIAKLLDDSSFVEVGAYVTARSTDFNMQENDTPKDGVITGYGVINETLVYVYSQDATVLGGAVGEMHAKKIANIYDMAMKVGAPVIGLIDCAGLRLQEATDAMNAFGELYLKQSLASGVIPQITAVFGTCGGGAALIPALTDFTFMTSADSKIFVNSPNALDGNYESKLDTASAEYISCNTSLVDGVFDSEEELLAQIRGLVDMLNDTSECTDDLNRIIPNLDGLCDNAREVLKNIADNNVFFEAYKGFAKDMVLGFIKLDGQAVGCVANQKEAGGDYLSTSGAYVAADFVKFCDAFSIPVLTLVNVKGFVGTVANERMIADAAAKLTYAFANSTVPKVTLVMGDAFGTAYTVMNSKAIGADMVYAWPGAKIGTMDPEMAVKIMYAKEIEAAEDKVACVAEYKETYTKLQSSAMAAAKRGYVDDIIEPDATRKRLVAAFDMLYAKTEERPYKKHGAF